MDTETLWKVFTATLSLFGIYLAHRGRKKSRARQEEIIKHLRPKTDEEYQAEKLRAMRNAFYYGVLYEIETIGKGAFLTVGGALIFLILKGATEATVISQEDLVGGLIGLGIGLGLTIWSVNHFLKMLDTYKGELIRIVFVVTYLMSALLMLGGF